MYVYVVDDDEVTLQMMEVVLESAGHPHRTFAQPQEAFRCLGLEPLPDLVITDLVAGPRRDEGYRLISQIRADARFAAVSVLAISGVTDVRDLARARALGADHCLRKPVDIAELTELLDRMSPR
ncbi:response regulator [Arthrobacter sp. NEB 688]|uniref:response regulator n=1 Tax=Arthrobacter sp. NEB 688 TaxID=904039 RepID=UPI001563D2CC|nr:response regulator [Arthrobacter sp. NEB 688]QKE82647.1 response regulator [Arthrobacter sp. NEB 688]